MLNRRVIPVWVAWLIGAATWGITLAVDVWLPRWRPALRGLLIAGGVTATCLLSVEWALRRRARRRRSHR